MPAASFATGQFLLTLVLQAPVSETPVSETIVTSPRSQRPASSPSLQVIEVDAEDLARTGERSLPRALAQAAGVFVQETNLGGGSPILRGLVGNQVLIVVDGVRLNDATTRGGPNQSLNGIDAACVERVEIVRGPSSVLYGSDALGGAILIWTKGRLSRLKEEAGERERRIRAVLDGSWHSVTDGVQSSLALSGAFENDGVFVSGSLHDWDDLRAGDNQLQENTGYEGHAWFGSFEHAIDAGRSLRVSAMRTRDFDVPRTDRLNPGFGQTQPSDLENQYSLQDRQRYVLSYEDRTPGGLADSLQWRLSYRRYDEERQIRGFTSSTRRLESDTTSTFGLGADFRRALGSANLLTFGLDVDFDEVDSLRDDVNVTTSAVTPKDGAFAPNSRYLSSGLFIQDEILAWEDFDVTLGMRYSYFDFDFDAFENDPTTQDESGSFDALTASAQVARDVTDSARLALTVSQGFRAPNLADLAKNGSFFGGTELANPDLEPEESAMVELAFDYQRPGWSVGTALYANELRDAIGARLIDDGGTPTTPGDDTYRRDNVGEVRLYGVEFAAQATLGGAQSPWSALARAEWTEGRQFDDTIDPATGSAPFDDVPARRIPPLHGSLGLRYERPASRTLLGWGQLTFHWALEQDELNPGDLTDPRIDPNGTAAWNTLDLDFGGPIGRPAQGSSWRIGLHNLFDELYRVHGSGFDAPGFGVVLGLQLSL